MAKRIQSRGARKRRNERRELLIECLADFDVVVSPATKLPELEKLARKAGVFDEFEALPPRPRLGSHVVPAIDQAQERLTESFRVDGDGELKQQRVPRDRLTRQKRRHAERATATTHFTPRVEGMNRKEIRKAQKEMQRREAESNRFIAEGRRPPERAENLDELLEQAEPSAGVE